LLTEKGTFYQEFIIERNQIVFERIQEVLKQTGESEGIIVSYGAGHMPMIEEFLLSIGFSPKKEGEEWLPVLDLN
jgi:hypothetical protein